MGTTLTAAYVADDAVVVAHVGDSRCYLLRDGDLIRLTRDHSLVGELVARGKLTEAQAEAHPQRSVITRALGAGADVEVDVDVFPARGGDLFLVCSDGLTGMVHEPQLKPLLQQDGSLERMGRSLIAAANEAGGRDNITVILFRLEEHRRRGRGTAGGAVTAESGRRAPTEYDTFAGEAVEPRQGVSRPSAAAPATPRRRSTAARARSRCRPSAATEGGSAAPAREPPPGGPRPCRGARGPGAAARGARAAGCVLLAARPRPPAPGRRLARHPRRLLRGHGPRRRHAPSPSSAASRTSCRSGSTSTSAGTRPA